VGGEVKPAALVETIVEAIDLEGASGGGEQPEMADAGARVERAARVRSLLLATMIPARPLHRRGHSVDVVSIFTGDDAAAVPKVFGRESGPTASEAGSGTACGTGSCQDRGFLRGRTALAAELRQ
jgi:uncharacterized protein (DUF2252 family)